MARGESLLRQWKLMNILQTRRAGVSLRDLAGLAGYSERTIQRDLRLLEEAGFPLAHEADEFGKRFWRLPHDFLHREGLVLSITEAVSLYFARQLLTPLHGTELADGLESIIAKIQSMLPSKALQHFDDLAGLILVRSEGSTDYTQHRDAIRALSEAVRGERVVRLTYQSLWRGETYETAVHPYGLVWFDGDLYVVGHSEHSRAVRVFKLTRVKSLQTTAARFHRPADFSLEEHFQGSFGIMQPGGQETEVSVEFDASVAALIEERRWHPSQRLERGPDGRLRATYRLGSTLEFKRWILSFGPAARVLSPASLRSDLSRSLQAAARHYADATPAASARVEVPPSDGWPAPIAGRPPVRRVNRGRARR